MQRTREVCGRIFRYAIATGRAKHDIAADLVGALASRTSMHHAAITDRQPAAARGKEVAAKMEHMEIKLSEDVLAALGVGFD